MEAKSSSFSDEPWNWAQLRDICERGKERLEETREWALCRVRLWDFHSFQFGVQEKSGWEKPLLENLNLSVRGIGWIKKNKFNPVYPVTIMHSESSSPSSLPSSVPSKPSWTVLSESASPLHQDDLSALDPLMVPRSPSHPCHLCQLQCPCFHSHHRLSPSHPS